MTTRDLLPADGAAGTLVGRVWDPGAPGPSVVRVDPDGLVDLSRVFPTMRDLWEHPDPPTAAGEATGPVLCRLDELAAPAGPVEASAAPVPLSPIDLQVVKAAGVTYSRSAIERVIEERARGDAAEAAGIRADLARDGLDFADVAPGTPEAARLKERLVALGMWSAYLEVAIGPDAEVFTKAPVLATVGAEAEVGVLGRSEWSNSEPEVALAVTSRGAVIGATLGNDINLRDIEGRSALLLPVAKDANASAALGPFVRLFDDTCRLEDVVEGELRFRVTGADGFRLDATGAVSDIRRRPEDLVRQVVGPHHAYPDGFVLYLGTPFAPTVDRGEPGMGFTHHVGDVIEISHDALGTLRNRVVRSEDAAPWTFGLAALFGNLARRGLVASAP